MYEEVTDSVFLDTAEDRSHDFDWRKECIGNAEKYNKGLGASGVEKNILTTEYRGRMTEWTGWSSRRFLRR